MVTGRGRVGGKVVVLGNVESLPHASSSPSIPGLMRDGVSIKWRGGHGVSCEGTELKIKIDPGTTEKLDNEVPTLFSHHSDCLFVYFILPNYKIIRLFMKKCRKYGKKKNTTLSQSSKKPMRTFESVSFQTHILA